MSHMINHSKVLIPQVSDSIGRLRNFLHLDFVWGEWSLSACFRQPLHHYIGPLDLLGHHYIGPLDLLGQHIGSRFSYVQPYCLIWPNTFTLSPVWCTSFQIYLPHMFLMFLLIIKNNQLFPFFNVFRFSSRLPLVFDLSSHTGNQFYP